MPEFYTWVIPLIDRSEEIGEKQLSDFVSRGGKISPLMHIAQIWTPYQEILDLALHEGFHDRNIHVKKWHPGRQREDDVCLGYL